MNENVGILPLRELMDRPEGWGRDQGREVYPRLIQFVESNPGRTIFKISMQGVKRLDMSFASETLVELVRRYRKIKGFCFIDLTDPDLSENIDAAAKKKEQPILSWHSDSMKIIGSEPSEGLREALEFTVERGSCRATEFASHKGMSIANASMKFKTLWEQGFLLRRESMADSGGVEFLYHRIR